MKKSVKASVTAIMASAIALSLTACDPPMPPDVAAQIAEQTYTCVEGNANVLAPEEMTDPILQWQASLPMSCVDPLPAMTITNDPIVPTDLYIGAQAEPTCKPFASAPIAVESANIVFSMSVTSSLYLTPATAAKILNGEITNWNDPAISKENVGTEFPDQAIELVKPTQKLAFDALSAWLGRLDASISSDSFELVTNAKAADYSALTEGQIAIVPGSYAMALGLYSASIINGVDNSTSEPLLANADASGISSAASQWKASASGNDVSVSLDPNSKPLVPAGFDFAAEPYQAIYPVNVYLCGDDNLLKRAVANFLLRLDSQGALGVSNYNQLNEETRTLALVTLRKGLPEPTVAPGE